MDQIQFKELTGWSRIGKGSFGAVSRCELWGTDVAVKEVYASTDFDWQKYLDREVSLLKECRHANIVQFMGTATDNGNYFIITEYVDGGNLRSYIWDMTQPMPWKLRVSFAIDIARALAYLHANDIIHRDLKPENLLLTDNLRVKVADFGFARLAAKNAEEKARMSYCGTDGYMSPEIMLGLDVTTSTDVFSFGVILCEILSRTLVSEKAFKRVIPGFGIDQKEVENRCNNGYPLDFLNLTLQCTNDQFDQRPPIQQVLIDLRKIELDLEDDDRSHVGTLRRRKPTRNFSDSSDEQELNDALDALENAASLNNDSEFYVDFFTPTSKLSFMTAVSKDTWNIDHPSDLINGGLFIKGEKTAENNPPSTIKLKKALDRLLPTTTMKSVILSSLPSSPTRESSEETVSMSLTSSIVPLLKPETVQVSKIKNEYNEEKPAILESNNIKVNENVKLPNGQPHRFSLITAFQRRQLFYFIGRCCMCNRRFGVSKPLLACDDCKKFRICEPCSLLPESIPQNCDGDSATK